MKLFQNSDYKGIYNIPSTANDEEGIDFLNAEISMMEKDALILILGTDVANQILEATEPYSEWMQKLVDRLGAVQDLVCESYLRNSQSYSTTSGTASISTDGTIEKSSVLKQSKYRFDAVEKIGDFTRYLETGFWTNGNSECLYEFVMANLETYPEYNEIVISQL